MDLRDWQKDAFETLRQHDFTGVVKVASGLGKTVLALAVIEKVLDMNTSTTDTSPKALVVVPTINLMFQWKKELKKFCPSLSSSFWYGQKKDERGDVVLAVINSAVYSEFKKKYLVKVLDEVHHYGAERYAAIFSIPTNHTIGLSATPERDDEGNLAIRYGAGKMVYSLSNLDELRDRFSLCSLRVPLTAPEYERYVEIQHEYRKIAALSNFDLSQVTWLGKRGNKYALYILKLWSELAKIRHNATHKMETLKLVLSAEQGKKIIVFSESIAFAERVGRECGAIVVHSGMSKKEVLAGLEQFKSARSGILVAPRLIDEGYDVPDANIAIIASFSRSARQMIQRDGRVLRTKGVIRRYTFVLDGVEEDKYFMLLQKTGMEDFARKGLWLRFDHGLIEDSEALAHFEEFVTDGSSFEQWVAHKLDLAQVSGSLDEEFFSRNQSIIERLTHQWPTRWPVLSSTKKPVSHHISTSFDDDTQRTLKAQVRRVNARVILPDNLFSALMRVIEGESFEADMDVKEYIAELAKEDKLGWGDDLFAILQLIAKSFSS